MFWFFSLWSHSDKWWKMLVLNTDTVLSFLEFFTLSCLTLLSCFFLHVKKSQSYPPLPQRDCEGRVWKRICRLCKESTSDCRGKKQSRPTVGKLQHQSATFWKWSVLLHKHPWSSAEGVTFTSHMWGLTNWALCVKYGDGEEKEVKSPRCKLGLLLPMACAVAYVWKRGVGASCTTEMRTGNSADPAVQPASHPCPGREVSCSAQQPPPQPPAVTQRAAQGC